MVLLQACADDWDDVTPSKEPGRSHVVEIHVIDRNEFDLTINQEQADVQQKLLRLREKELRRAEAGGGGGTSPQARGKDPAQGRRPERRGEEAA